MAIVRSPTILSVTALVFAVLGWVIAVGGCGYAGWADAHRKRSPLDIGVPVGEMLAIALGALLALAGLVVAVVAFWRGERSSLLWAGTALAGLLAFPLLYVFVWSVTR